MPRFAAIDLGSNTFRLLIAAPCGPGHFKILHSENRTVRLGEGFSQAKWIGAEASARALSALKAFQDALTEHNIKHLLACGTSALREAKNQGHFLQEVKEKTGLEVRILSGKEEARYTLKGVRCIFPEQKQRLPIFVLDIGGGSSELIVDIHAKDPPLLMSTSLGTLILSERYLCSDPPMDSELLALRSAIDQELYSIADPIPKPCLFAGTAGTVTSLAAIDLKMRIYNPEKINGHRMPLKRIREMLYSLSKMTHSERCALPGLEKGRAGLLVAGTMILVQAMERFKVNLLHVSDYGLREGLLLELMQSAL